MANTNCSRGPALRWRTVPLNPKPEARNPTEARNPKAAARPRVEPPDATRLSTQRRQGAKTQKKVLSEAWLGASTVTYAGPIQPHQLRALAPWRRCVNASFSGLHEYGLTSPALEHFRAIHSPSDRHVAPYGGRAADGMPGL